MQNNQKHMFVLEGNIGAGKSTLLTILEHHLPTLSFVLEPTTKWQHVGSDDNNILNLFYKDTKRWGYTFQSYAFISRVQSILEAQETQEKNSIAVFERSVYCDRFCFAKNCFESGLMTELEWQIYKEWFAWLVESHVPQPTGFIYLKTTPQTCHQRSLKRSRLEETGIAFNYLEALHKKHEDWLINKNELLGNIKNIPVLTIDCNDEFENNVTKQKEHVEAIKQFIEKTTGGSITIHLPPQQAPKIKYDTKSTVPLQAR